MSKEIAETLSSLRRKYVKSLGRRLVRKLDKYLASQSLVPDEPVFQRASFPWLANVEERWEAVAAEARALLQRREELPFLQDISPDQRRISPDDKWRAFFLYGFGRRMERNCSHCPQTAALLKQVPGIQNALFSFLAPGKIVPAHRGFSKSIIRCHLGLVVPTPPDQCFMDIGNARYGWQPGRLLIFDDTCRHSVSNNSDQERVVLLFDIPRPLRWPGRLLRDAIIWGVRRTAYFKDTFRNQAQWEQRQSFLDQRNGRGRKAEVHLAAAALPTSPQAEDRNAR
jgi:aspartyl/asparaginyl beta-hydroxylase (cupin superfamily)